MREREGRGRVGSEGRTERGREGEKETYRRGGGINCIIVHHTTVTVSLTLHAISPLLATSILSNACKFV